MHHFIEGLFLTVVGIAVCVSGISTYRVGDYWWAAGLGVVSVALGVLAGAEFVRFLFLNRKSKED